MVTRLAVDCRLHWTSSGRHVLLYLRTQMYMRCGIAEYLDQEFECASGLVGDDHVQPPYMYICTHV